MVELVECSSIAREIWVQSQVEPYQRLKKWYSIPPCLTLSTQVHIKGKVEQSQGKSSALYTPWCSSNWKGSLRVALANFTDIYIYIYIYVISHITHTFSWSSWLGLQNTPTKSLQRATTPPRNVLDTTINHSMVMPHQWLSFGVWRVPLHCHRYQVHSGSEW